jgi:hypothetical protein
MTAPASDHGERVNTLCGMLSTRRRAGGRQERRFIQEFIQPVARMKQDGAGNLMCTVGDEAPRVLWSCHTDTVHRAGGRQRLKWRGVKLTLGDSTQSNCLGADDTAGVWLMREMILAQKPGLYVFHRGEEIGGIGSSWLAKHTPSVLNGIEAAIAFDRRGTADVITHQFGGRCCSTDFAKSLAAGLNAGGLKYKPNSGGSFTDTANYTDLVGECTNLSVGYRHEHSKDEELDVQHLLDLRAALLRLDTASLVIKRKPGEIDWSDYGDSLYGLPYASGGSNSLGRRYRNSGYPIGTIQAGWVKTHNGWEALADMPEDRRMFWEACASNEAAARDATTTTTTAGTIRALSPQPDDPGTSEEEEEGGNRLDRLSMAELVEAYPEVVADILEQMGMDEKSLAEEIAAYLS